MFECYNNTATFVYSLATNTDDTVSPIGSIKSTKARVSVIMYEQHQTTKSMYNGKNTMHFSKYIYNYHFWQFGTARHPQVARSVDYVYLAMQT